MHIFGNMIISLSEILKNKSKNIKSYIKVFSKEN